MTFQDVAFQVSTAQVKIIEVTSSAQGLTMELLQVVTIHNGNRTLFETEKSKCPILKKKKRKIEHGKIICGHWVEDHGHMPRVDRRNGRCTSLPLAQSPQTSS